MRLIQARVPDAVYELLRKSAKQTGRPMQKVVEEALREHLLSDVVDPNDPIFTAWPLVKAKGRRRERTSEQVDVILYGARP